MIGAGSAFAFASFLVAPAFGQTTSRASVNSAGVGGDAQSLSPDISADGRYVTFVSLATNLVPGDTNGFLDVFIRDLQTGATERVSLASSGAQGNHHSGDWRPAISADGRFVVFGSSATNLVANDTNLASDAFVHDRLSGTTERVSVSSTGAQADGPSGSYGVALSADGRFVAFVSSASNLVFGDTNGTSDVFVRDRLNDTTERVSLSSAGAQGDSSSGGYYLGVSVDGRFVAFGSYASNLAPGGASPIHHVYVRDRQTATTERVSVNGIGTAGDADSGFNGLSLSGDGRYVVFESEASNLAPGVGPGNVFIRDRVVGTTALVSVAWCGAQGVGSSFSPTISSDGRYVAFVSYATNVVPADTNSGSDVFVRDLANGTNERVSLTSSGAQANGDSGQNGIALSSDGRYVAFASAASDLVSGDTNGAFDVFRRDRGWLYPGTFCTAGTTTSGCVPSIGGTGTPSASAPSGFVIDVAAVEGQKQGLIFYGLDNSGFTPSPWGTGFFCVKPPVQRTLLRSSGGTTNLCDGAFTLDWNAFRATNPGSLGQPFNVGQRVFTQAWFRDPPSAKTTAFSDALEFTVGP